MKTDVLWLIRKSRGEIEGPLEFSELKAQLLSGQVSIDSEICPGNSHWLTFHDLDDLKTHFEDKDLHQILRVLRGTQEFQDDDTRTDIATSENVSTKQKGQETTALRTPLGMERIQFFTLFFLSGVVIALLIVIWILYTLKQSPA